ncbi:MAG: S1/P1 Nuclease [Betaproteobacteria bacterium]|nr:S1/P1 Nuclease [Betaproteobacteria bacterium]
MAYFLHKKHAKQYYPRPSLHYQGLIGLILSIFCSTAQAWGDVGHEVVMAIAWQHLTEHSQQAIQQLIDQDTDNTLTAKNPIAIATWADRYRSQKQVSGVNPYQQTHLWHFVDLDIDHPNLNEACYQHPTSSGFASAGPSHDCIVDKIEAFSRELKLYHASQRRDEQQEAVLALKFLIHFVGDLHQPLHASNHHDNGGNKLTIIVDHKKISLHHFWDTTLVHSLGTDPVLIAQTLNQGITEQVIHNWQRGNLVDWTRESFKTAKEVIYMPLLMSGDSGYYNDPSHYNEAVSIVRIELEEAGIRLALLLNEDLR